MKLQSRFLESKISTIGRTPASCTFCRLYPEDFLDRAQDVHGGIARRDDCVLLHIRAREEGDAAMRIDVVGTVLRVVLDDEDQR